MRRIPFIRWTNDDFIKVSEEDDKLTTNWCAIVASSIIPWGQPPHEWSFSFCGEIFQVFKRSASCKCFRSVTLLDFLSILHWMCVVQHESNIASLEFLTGTVRIFSWYSPLLSACRSYMFIIIIIQRKLFLSNANLCDALIWLLLDEKSYVFFYHILSSVFLFIWRAEWLWLFLIRWSCCSFPPWRKTAYASRGLYKRIDCSSELRRSVDGRATGDLYSFLQQWNYHQRRDLLIKWFRRSKCVPMNDNEKAEGIDNIFNMKITITCVAVKGSSVPLLRCDSLL